MGKLKKITMLIMALCMLSANGLAETQNTTFKATINGENVSVKEDNLTINEDNSNLLVNVIKYKGDQQTIMYSGALSGYADGMYSDVEFSKIQCLFVFDWDGSEDEAICIIPSSTQAISDTTVSNTAHDTISDENIIVSQNTLSTGTIQTNISLMYNNKYHENVLLPNQTLTVPITITNTGNASIEILPYIAIYDLSGKLIDLNQGNLIVSPANQTISTTVSNEFNTDTACTAKVFFWQKSNMKPITDSIYLTIQNQDYYADTYAQTNKIDIDKPLCGVINTGEDVDIVKFTPTATGIYALQLDASVGTICGLYDNTQTLLNSVSAVEDKNYLLYSLTANQDYYIRFNGTENNSYEITPALPNELVTLTKNIGTSDNLLDNTDFNIYKFTPTITGSYVITAVDSSCVTADLYNASFEKIASADETDTSVSFRITNDMTADQSYYIVVYPKSESVLDSYTMYVEEPFALISVE